MTLTPLLSAPFEIQFHVLCAIASIILGPIALLRRSRDRWHRRVGKIWVAAMGLTALSSFAISDSPMFGPFSIIHGLSVLTLWGLWQGVGHARAGQIAAHRKEMKGLYFWAMGVAGLFTFLPGRRMNEVVSAANPELGFIIAAIVIGSLLTWYMLHERAAHN